MSHIFISYSQADRMFADRIFENLTAMGFNVWIDIEGIAGGQNWLEAIETAIKNADVVIVLMSPTSIESRWVIQEIHYALALDKRILPILISPINWSDIPLALAQYQFLDMSSDGSEANVQNYARLVKALKSFEQSDVLQPPPDSVSFPSPDDIKREEAAIRNTPLPDRIFIAYSRKQRLQAVDLSNLLTRNGKSVFYDAKIRAGAMWRRKIQKALDDATHLVVLWTHDAAASDEVEREVSYALAEHKVIVPLLSKDIPKLPYHLHGLHYIVFDNDLSVVEIDLLKAIEQVADSEDIWQ